MTTGISDVLAAIDSALEDCTVSGDATRSCPDAGRVICDRGGGLWPERYTAGGWPSSWIEPGPAAFQACSGQWSGTRTPEINVASQSVTRGENFARVRVTVDPASLPRAGYCKVLFTEPIYLAAGTLVVIETDGIPGPSPAPGGMSWRTGEDCTMTSLWCG